MATHSEGSRQSDFIEDSTFLSAAVHLLQSTQWPRWAEPSHQAPPTPNPREKINKTGINSTLSVCVNKFTPYEHQAVDGGCSVAMETDQLLPVRGGGNLAALLLIK